MKHSRRGASPQLVARPYTGAKKKKHFFGGVSPYVRPDDICVEYPIAYKQYIDTEASAKLWCEALASANLPYLSPDRLRKISLL